MLSVEDLYVFSAAETVRPAAADVGLGPRTILKPVLHCLKRRYTPYRDDDLHDSLGLQQQPPRRARRDAVSAGTSGFVAARPSVGASL